MRIRNSVKASLGGAVLVLAGFGGASAARLDDCVRQNSICTRSCNLTYGAGDQRDHCSDNCGLDLTQCYNRPTPPPPGIIPMPSLPSAPGPLGGPPNPLQGK